MNSPRFTILDQYLVREIVFGLLLAAAVIVPLFGFLDLIEQLEDVGEGYYRTEDAFFYVANLVPRRITQLAPFIALLGTVIALGRLAASHELIAMRGAGLSLSRLGRTTAWVAAGVLLLVAVLEQFLAPRQQQAAMMRRSEAMALGSELGQDLGIWARNPANVLRLSVPVRTGRTTDVEIFELDDAGFLRRHLHAAEASLQGDGNWRLEQVTRRTFDDTDPEVDRLDRLDWVSFLDRKQAATLARPPGSLSVSELWVYVEYLRDTGQDARAHALTLWRKAGSGFLTVAMMLLSIPFAAMFSRTGLGTRLLLAGLTGLGIYLLDQMIANAGLLLHLSPPLVALVPSVLLLGAALVLLRRAT
jgi:lipopolysaccharide export system permease protein